MAANVTDFLLLSSNVTTSPTPGELTTNHSDLPYVPSDKRLYEVAIKAMNMFVLPMLILIGLLGNSLSFIVFVCTHLKYQSASVYLAFLNVVDSVFLISLALSVWLGWIRVFLFHKEGFCQLVIYLTYVSSFLSVWTVVAFTIERYIVVYHPFRRVQFCTRDRAIVVVSALGVGTMVTYAFTLWTHGIQDRGYCGTHPEYMTFMHRVTIADTFITFVIPCVIIVVFNFAIAIKIAIFVLHRRQCLVSGYAMDHRYDTTQKQKNRSLRGNHKGSMDMRRNELREGSESGQKRTRRGEKPNSSCSSEDKQNTSLIEEKQNSGCSNEDKENRTLIGDKQKRSLVADKQRASTSSSSSDNKRETPNSKTPTTTTGIRIQHGQALTRRIAQFRITKSLLIVSSVFVLFNLPSHAIRLYALAINTGNSPAYKIGFYQQIFQMLAYANFSLNFFLYCLCSRQFRSAFVKLMVRCKRACTNCCHRNILRVTCMNK